MMKKIIVQENNGFSNQIVKSPINKSPLIKKLAGRFDSTIAHVG